MKNFKLKVLKTERQHAAALRQIETLWDSRPRTDEYDALQVLALLVETYERRAVPFEAPDPVAAILFRMEQRSIEPRDRVPLMGSRSRVSEVLNRKRPLTLEMIRGLNDKLQIPLESLVARYKPARKRINRAAHV